MSTPDSPARPALTRLARVLAVPTERLDYLAAVSDADLIAFRAQITQMLARSQAKALGRIAAAATLLPAAVAAKLLKAKPNALLAARIAALLEPARAADIAKRLSPEFLAGVATQLDPGHDTEVLRRLPNDRVVAVARRLADRADWITLADLVTRVSDTAIQASIDALGPIIAVHTVLVVENSDALTRYSCLLSDAMAADMRRAAEKLAVMADFERIVAQLPDSQRYRFAATDEHTD